MNKLVKGIHHVSLRAETEELFEKTLNLYHNILGMPILRRWGEGAGRGVMIDSGVGLLEIFASNPNSAPAPRHIAFATDSVDSCISAVTAAGYMVTVEPKETTIPSAEPYHAKIAFFVGDLGEEIEFFEER